MIAYRRAFSLIEMLVAVILLTLLLGVALFSFRHLFITFRHVEKGAIDKTIIYNQIRSSIESMKYYVVDDYDALKRPMKNLHFFFKGEVDSMIYITTNANFSETTSLAKLSCVDDRLVYIEEKLYANQNYLQPDFSDSAEEITLYDNLSHCSFLYYKFLDTYSSNSALKDFIPKYVELKLRSTNMDKDIFIAVRSDNNMSTRLDYDLLYE
jgi:prepilin-type N-terminal cleavage/methylation domain-containing protein